MLPLRLVIPTQPRYPTTISLQDQDVKRLEGLIIPVIIKTEDTVTRVFLNGKDPLGPQLLDFLGVSGETIEKQVAHLLPAVSGGKVQAFYRGELDNEATVEVHTPSD